ncbi:MAG: glycosyltransferase [Paludibacteraceae bacterium]|nr:glycosyltransferase [Paludibacteraceae bacterium]
MPKVSVIVPCYNVEKYLNQCVESITNQTLQDLQVILVDDCSPDSVPMICDKWAEKDSRVLVVHKENNEGLGKARNSGLDVATGDFVAFVDSDDFVDVTMFENLYHQAQLLHSDVVLCNSIVYNEQKGLTNRYDVKEIKTFEGREAVDSFLLDLVAPMPEYPKDVKYMMSVWHGIYRRELLEKNNIRFKSERDYVSEDLIFNIDLYPCVNKVVYIPDCLYFYRYNGDSLSHKFDRIKYEKMKKSLSFVSEKLDLIYGEKASLRSERLKFLYLRIFLKKSVIYKQSNVSFSEILEDEYWAKTIDSYPYYRMDTKHRLFFLLLKHRAKIILRLIVAKL